MSKKAFYITTTLPYVNADPHIGFATEVLQADVLARYRRLQGADVFFNTGTDEHGQKVFEAAKEAGENVTDYANRHVSEVQKLKEVLDLSNDAFIRTTDKRHIKAAQEMWKRCFEKGDIEKKKYKGLYCVGDEIFMKESELVDGKCPNHPNMELREIEEENWFFKLSKYKKKLQKYLENQDGGNTVYPSWRYLEALNLLEDAPDELSISREKKRLSWGVPVPDDDSQVMYVWFDALTSYISTLGWPDDKEGNFKKFWEEGETLQFAGKDQIRFQSIIWQAMLMSADIKTTDQIFYHGFIISGGQRMSKSLGNVISPRELVERYGRDATRYLLLRHVHPVHDTDITWKRLDEWYEAHLVNGLGNLVARVMQMAISQNVTVPKFDSNLDENNRKNSSNFFNNSKYIQHMENFEFDKAADNVWHNIGWCDAHIQANKPFKEVKENPEQAKKDIREELSALWQISLKLQPFMPDTAKIIKQAIKENKKPETLFPRKDL